MIFEHLGNNKKLENSGLLLVKERRATRKGKKSQRYKVLNSSKFSDFFYVVVDLCHMSFMHPLRRV